MKSIFILLGLLLFVPILPTYHTGGKKTSRNTERISSVYRFNEYSSEVKAYIYKQSTRSSVIIAPSLPIRYNIVDYYWSGNYNYDRLHPQKCEFPIEETDYEFENVTFADGSKPDSIQFGCLNYQDCCGFECCGDSRSTTVVFCIVVLGGLLFYKVADRYSKYMTQKRGSIASNVVTVTSPLLNPNVQIHAV